MYATEMDEAQRHTATQKYKKKYKKQIREGGKDRKRVCASEMDETQRHRETQKYRKRVTEPVTPSVKGV